MADEYEPKVMAQIQAYDTDDIQYDLAGAMNHLKKYPPKDGEDCPMARLARAYTAELERRGAKIPHNVRAVYDPYARGKERIEYDL